MSAEVDLSKTQYSSFTAELKDEGVYEASYPLSGTLGIGATQTSRFDVPFGALDNRGVIILIRIQVLGATSPIPNFWYPLNGELVIYDQPKGYALYFDVEGGISGRELVVQAINETVGSTVTLPSLTINVHARFYSYPWGQ